MSKRGVLGIVLALAGLVAVIGIGVLVAGDDDRRLGAVSADKRGYVAGKWFLEVGGTSVGALYSVKGCGVGANVIDGQVDAAGVVRKHVGHPAYDSCVIEVGPEMGSGLYQWVVDTLNRKFGSKNLTIVATDFNYKARGYAQLSNAILKKVKFPALDAASKDAARLELTIQPELVKWLPGDGATISAGPGGKGPAQKKWLPSNFRLTLSGLKDAAGVSKISSFEVTQEIAQDEVGEQREATKQPAQLKLGHLTLSVADAQSAEFDSWLDDFVVKGMNGAANEKTATLQFLSPNMKDILFTLSFSGVGIFRGLEEAGETGSESIRRKTYWLYVEDASLVVGAPAVAPPPPPPPPSTSTTPPPPAPEPPPPATTTEETVPTETKQEELAPGPEKLEATSGPERGDVQLTWSPVADAEGYVILIAREPGGPYDEVGETRRTSFIVGGLDSEVPYYFVVRAVVFGDETADSPEVSAAAG